MSDRSALTLHIHDCPAEQAAAVLAVIDEYSLNVEWVDPAPADVLYAGRAYTDDEAPLGSEDTIASALIKAAPGCAFTIWQDPKYEYDGELVMYHPDLGRYGCSCDANGSVHLTLETLDVAVARFLNLVPDATAQHLAAELHRCFGVPWTAAFATCTQREIVPAQSIVSPAQASEAAAVRTHP